MAALTGRDFVTRSDQRALLTAPNLPVTNTRQILAAGQILTTQIETNMGQRYSENTALCSACTISDKLTTCISGK